MDAFKKLSQLVLVCQAPPHATLVDAIAGGQHIGSRAVRAFVDAHHPAYLFCGHVHEGAGKSEKLGETEVANVGKRGYLLEI